MKPIIALDCDGVLLDYNHTYGIIYEKSFGIKPKIVNNEAYHANNYFNLSMTDDEKKVFFSVFDKEGWKDMKALPQAIEAVDLLDALGFEIVCVTAMPHHAEKDRLFNLKNLGFKIDKVIATGSSINGENPKKKYIEQIKPQYFADDLLHNFHNIETDTKFVLIEWKSFDSPNHGQDFNIAHYRHDNLYNFVSKELH